MDYIAQMGCLVCRPGGTLTVDRAWMEELLMSEMDTRCLPSLLPHVSRACQTISVCISNARAAKAVIQKSSQLFTAR